VNEYEVFDRDGRFLGVVEALDLTEASTEADASFDNTAEYAPSTDVTTVEGLSVRYKRVKP
jgi:hypothetical protein